MAMSFHLLIEKTFRDGLVGIDAAVAEKGPVATRLLDEMRIDFADENLLFVVRGLGNDAAERVGKKRSAPELDALTFSAVAANIAVFVADAVDRTDIHSVGNGMGALDGLPGAILRLAKLGFFRWMPADRGRIEQNAGALQPQ